MRRCHRRLYKYILWQILQGPLLILALHQCHKISLDTILKSHPTYPTIWLSEHKYSWMKYKQPLINHGLFCNDRDAPDASMSFIEKNIMHKKMAIIPRPHSLPRQSWLVLRWERCAWCLNAFHRSQKYKQVVGYYSTINSILFFVNHGLSCDKRDAACASRFVI